MLFGLSISSRCGGRHFPNRLPLLDVGALFFKKFSAPYSENEITSLSERARLVLKSFSLMGYHAIRIGDDDLRYIKLFLKDLGNPF